MGWGLVLGFQHSSMSGLGFVCAHAHVCVCLCSAHAYTCVCVCVHACVCVCVCVYWSYSELWRFCTCVCRSYAYLGPAHTWTVASTTDTRHSPLSSTWTKWTFLHTNLCVTVSFTPNGVHLCLWVLHWMMGGGRERGWGEESRERAGEKSHFLSLRKRSDLELCILKCELNEF